jgi:hypothetical protein
MLTIGQFGFITNTSKYVVWGAPRREGKTTACMLLAISHASRGTDVTVVVPTDRTQYDFCATLTQRFLHRFGIDFERRIRGFGNISVVTRNMLMLSPLVSEICIFDDLGSNFDYYAFFNANPHVAMKIVATFDYRPNLRDMPRETIVTTTRQHDHHF